MLTTIVLTAILTAAAVMALSHRGRSYIYNLEQTAMNQAEELIDLRDVRRRLVTQLENERLNVAGATDALRIERAKVLAAQREISRVVAEGSALAMRLAIAEARAPELHLVDPRV